VRKAAGDRTQLAAALGRVDLLEMAQLAQRDLFHLRGVGAVPRAYVRLGSADKRAFFPDGLAQFMCGRMPWKLPSLTQLRAFQAAECLGSFKAAAERIGIEGSLRCRFKERGA
jgi:hypothetical protein